MVIDKLPATMVADDVSIPIFGQAQYDIIPSEFDEATQHHKQVNNDDTMCACPNIVIDKSSVTMVTGDRSITQLG